MPLTHEDIEKLSRPFAVEAHEFNQRGFCYVAEEEVTARLDDVDPSWTFEIQSIKRDGIGNQQCIVTARMTVKGVYRDSTGMQMIEYQNKKDGAGKTEIEAGEGEKAATTDALRRCARLFGIGRYILKMGASVKDKAQLEAWLKKNYPPAAAPKPAEEKKPEAPKLARCLAGDEECQKQFAALRKELGITDDRRYLDYMQIERYSDYTGVDGTFDNLCMAIRNLHARFKEADLVTQAAAQISTEQARQSLNHQTGSSTRKSPFAPPVAATMSNGVPVATPEPPF